VLRRALVRGQLTEASARQRDLCAVRSAGGARPGCESLDPAECEHAMRVLLEGIGSILAGDGVGGGRTLNELITAPQPNLTFRWIAYHWSTLAALKSGNLIQARQFVKEALTIARQIDMEAHAVSQWSAAEVLANAGDPARALAWLNEARGRFERLGDRWGLGQTWFAEARIRASAQREHEAVEAARMALAVNPGWDEPATFLARRALMRDDLSAAEEILQPLDTPAADRVRELIEAIRQGTVNQSDASEFLKEQDAAPSPESIRVLERIAGVSPNFVQAREALAWMLLKIGRYADAGTIFRGLLAQPLSPPDRASVMLGMGCIAHAQQAGAMHEKQLRAVMDASKNPLAVEAASDTPSLPSLGSSVLTANGGAQAVFSGQLSGFALPDLLEFLRGARRTGLLACSSTAGMAALRFRDGWITGAAAPGTPDIGQLLVSAGKLSVGALRTVAARQGSDPHEHLLGELLVRDGLVDAAAVQEALRRQIELAVREVIGWKNGEFAFNRDENEKSPASEIPVSVDPQVVLLEVFKELDEASRSSTVDVEI
jgi:tetratricopeptide (TPR) repeat protein